VNIRNIDTREITEAVSRLSREANTCLPDDVLRALVLDQVLENARLAEEQQMPLCQDCGTAVVFLEIGQDVHITGGDLYEAVNGGIRQGYDHGFLRKSMVVQPFSVRSNTGDNTPAVIHTDIVPGDRLKITLAPKGGGSENMSRLYMLTPADGRRGIIDSVVQAVNEAGSNPCPPVIAGVGIGGTAEKAMELAKRALLRKTGEPNADPETAELEKDVLEHINLLGIGPQGFGGRVTALAVHIEVFPSHIASLPLAINLQCHAARHKEVVL
jgi:fumarate hydratase subunit alpha